MGFHDENITIPDVSAFYKYGYIMPFPQDIMFFSLHESYYKSYYKTDDINKICSDYKNKIKTFDFIIVPDSIRVDKLFDNKISKAVSWTAIRASKDTLVWHLDTIINTETFGRLYFYLKKN